MSSDYSNTSSISQQPLSSIFEWMPTCALVIDTNGIIQEINQKAIQFFRASTKEDFIFDKQNIKNMIIDTFRAVELIKLICKSSEPVNKEVLIRRFDKSIVSVDLHACLFPNNKTDILIQFTEKKVHNQVFLNEFSQAFRREAQRLKPYLNKPGKNILEEILINDMVEGIVSDKPSQNNQVVVVGEERINQLTKLFPEFSKRELIFCGYLSLKMSIDDISSLTGKTPNSLRVSFHRILLKTDYSTGKELLRKLESLK